MCRAGPHAPHCSITLFRRWRFDFGWEKGCGPVRDHRLGLAHRRCRSLQNVRRSSPMLAPSRVPPHRRRRILHAREEMSVPDRCPTKPALAEMRRWEFDGGMGRLRPARSRFSPSNSVALPQGRFLPTPGAVVPDVQPPIAGHGGLRWVRWTTRWRCVRAETHCVQLARSRYRTVVGCAWRKLRDRRAGASASGDGLQALEDARGRTRRPIGRGHERDGAMSRPAELPAQRRRRAGRRARDHRPAASDSQWHGDDAFRAAGRPRRRRGRARDA